MTKTGRLASLLKERHRLQKKAKGRARPKPREKEETVHPFMPKKGTDKQEVGNDTARKLNNEKKGRASPVASQQIKKADNTGLLNDPERVKLSRICQKRNSEEFIQRLNSGVERKIGSLNPLEMPGLFIKDENLDKDGYPVIPARSHIKKDVDESHSTSSPSSSRAQRVAMLKSRFADIIAKAERTLLDKGSKVDHVKLPQEINEVDQNLKKEKLQLRNDLRTTHDATKMIRANAARKSKIVKERQAARISLQQMKKTVDLDNTELLKDIASLNLSYSCHKRKADELDENLKCRHKRSRLIIPLERLGLFLKDEDEIYEKDNDLWYMQSNC